jgi:hypothetical protein
LTNQYQASEKCAPFVLRQTPPDDATADNGLAETFEKEREYMRERLRGELKREPTEKELDEWLQQHTEGY